MHEPDPGPVLNPDDPFLHEVIIPDGMEPAEWALAHCSGEPGRFPEEWPPSSRMCLAVVIRHCPEPDHDCKTAMYLVTRPEKMRALTAAQPLAGRQILWFRMLRRLFTPALCPTLRPAHWPPEETSED